MDMTDTQFVANKVFTMWGRPYLPGDPVDVSHLPGHKIGQLLNQRYLRPADPADAVDPLQGLDPRS